MARTLTLRPPAKINLTLQVGPRLASGFHDVRTILQSIAISDALTFTPRRGPFALRTRARGLPADRTNLVWRAADAIWRAAGRAGDARDVRIAITKAIPMAAGLGGGSADAAAALVGLNRVWELGLSRSQLGEIAASLGSDVPFFLVGGTAIGLDRGDTVFPLEDARRLDLVVIKPAAGVATADAYRWLDEDRDRGRPGHAAPPRRLDLGWPTGPLSLVNDLEGPVARRVPVVAEMVAACLEHGARAAAMTGSGSAVFGAFAPRTCARARRGLVRRGWQVVVTRTLTRAEASRRMGL